MVPSHYLNQWWNVVNWTLGNKFQWNLNRKLNIFNQDNAFENVAWKMAVILSRPQCVNQYTSGFVADMWILISLFSHRQSYSKRQGSGRWTEHLNKVLIKHCPYAYFKGWAILKWHHGFILPMGKAKWLLVNAHIPSFSPNDWHTCST